MDGDFQIKIRRMKILIAGWALVAVTTNIGFAQSPPRDFGLLSVWSSEDRVVRRSTDPPDEFWLGRVPQPAFAKRESRSSEDSLVCEPQMTRLRLATMRTAKLFGGRIHSTAVPRGRDFGREPVRAVLR